MNVAADSNSQGSYHLSSLAILIVYAYPWLCSAWALIKDPDVGSRFLTFHYISKNKSTYTRAGWYSSRITHYTTVFERCKNTGWWFHWQWCASCWIWKNTISSHILLNSNSKNGSVGISMALVTHGSVDGPAIRACTVIDSPVEISLEISLELIKYLIYWMCQTYVSFLLNKNMLSVGWSGLGGAGWTTANIRIPWWSYLGFGLADRKQLQLVLDDGIFSDTVAMGHNIATTRRPKRTLQSTHLIGFQIYFNA